MTSHASTEKRLGLKRPDEFLTAVRGFFDGMAKRTGLVMGVVIALAVVAAASAFYLTTKEAKSEAGRDALFKARLTLDKELTAIAALEAPKPAEPKSKDAKTPPPPAPTAAAVQYKKLDVDAKLAQGVAQLKEVVAKHSGTRAAFEARLALGDLYFNHGDPAKAVSFYQEAVSGAPANFEKAIALSSAGYALENAGKPAEALPFFEKALNLGEAGLKGDLLLAMARGQELTKDTAKAKATYDQILSQLPNTEASRLAEIYKSRLQ